MAADLERALLRLPNVAACAVLAKDSALGLQCIAYVVPAGAFARKTVESRLFESAPEVKRPDAYVLVSKLPLTERGDLDEAALLRLPVPDERIAQAIESELLADPRIERAAVFVEQLERRPTAFHVSDLALSDAAVPPAAPSGTPAPEQQADAPAADVQPPEQTPRALAVRHGPPLEREPGGPETLPDALRIAAERVKDRGITYLSNDGTTHEQSLPELLAEARRICRGLQDRGLLPGKHVLLQLADADDVLPAFWGCLLGGFIPAITPIPPSYEAGTNELERLCQVWQLLDGPPFILRERLKPAFAPLQARLGIEPGKLLILDELRGASEAYEAPALNAEDTAFLVFTSGSTGAPKIIMLSHRNILTRSQGTNQLCGHDTSDRILNWLPFDHIGSISDWHLRCIDLGCHMVYCAKEYVLGDPLNWLRLIDRFRITHSWAPNFAYALVNEALNRTNETFELSSMKALLTAGEAVSSNTVHEFLRRLASHGLSSTALRPAFGMAELGSGVTYYLPTPENPVRVQHVDRTRLEGALYPVEPNDPRAIGFTSLGPVIPGAGMRIVDDNKNPVSELTIGRLHISGGPVCRGYFRNDEANREVFVGDGWFNTGDRGFIADGELYLTGRDKESLIINGANYSNSEIEAVVEEVPGVQVSFVAACAVRPVGDPEERLAIFFAPSGAAGHARADLLRKIQNSITRKTGVKPDYLLPVAREVIPKTAIGKIQRKQLVKRFESGEFAALLKKVDVLLENERTIPDWFLLPSFRPRALRKAAAPSARSFLLLADRHGLAEELRLELERRAARVVVSEAAQAPGQAKLEFTDVVHLAGYAPARTVENGGGGHVAAASVSSAAAGYVLDVLGALSRCLREAGGAPRLWVIASHSQAAAPTDAIDAARIMLSAALMAFAQDTGAVDCRHIDLEFAERPSEISRRAGVVADELEALAAQPEVAFRAGTRLAPSFARVAFPPPGTRTSTIQKGGFYLVTGGLGGVGAELVRHLLTVHGAKLLIIGRTPIDAGAPEADNDSTRRKRELLAELNQLGSVRYRAGDLRDAASIERAVAEVEAELSQPLAGVFHLASVYRERPATEESPASFASAIASKVDGAIALHELLARRPEAFIVCFSSVVSFFSAAGNAAYAAANRFVDAYCHEQRNRHGKRSYSIDWSVWDGVATEGAAQEILSQLGGDGGVSAAEISARLAEAGRARGYLRIPVTQGMRSLSAALSLAPGQLLVGVDVANPNLRNDTLGDTEPLLGIRGAFELQNQSEECDPEALVLASARDRFGQKVPFELRALPSLPLTADGHVDREAVLSELRGASRTIVLPQTPLEQKLAEIWKEVLGLESLGITESFFDLGGTSLLSVRLFAEIERRIGVSLQLATLFQAATIRALAELLEAKLGSGPITTLAMLAEATGEPALFLIHDTDGQTDLYRPLASRLAPEVRVYGIAPHGKDRIPLLHTRIGDMVASHVERIREVQASGPYLVGGSGAGGVLAFEVACRLQALGQEVALVALFDAPDAGLRAGFPDVVRRGLARLLGGKATALEHARRVAKSGFDQVRVRLLDRYVSAGATPPWFLEFIPPRVVYGYASSSHHPSQFRGRLTLYRATRGMQDDAPARERYGDERLGWEPRATAGVDVVDVAGGHLSMLDEPHVAGLAAQLLTKLREAYRIQPEPGRREVTNRQPLSAA